MFFHTILPSEKLKKYIQFYWYFLIEEQEEPIEEHLIPNGSADIIFCLGEPWSDISSPDEKTIDHSVIIGASTKAKTLRFSPRTRLVGVSLKPSGLHPVLRKNCSSFTDQVIQLRQVIPEEEILLDQFRNNPFESGIPILERTLLTYFENYFTNHLVTESIFQISTARGDITIDKLCEKLRTSKTNLERIFFQTVGVSPKTFAKIYRLRYCISLKVKEPNLSFTSIVYDCSYYDQSHFIKDFRRFTGLSPKQYFQRTSFLSDNLIGTQGDQNVFTAAIAC